MTSRLSFAARSLNTVLAFGMVVGLAPAAFAQSDPHVGAWKLDLRRSVYTPGPPPRAQTRTYTPHGDGLKGVIETIQPFGIKTTSEYAAHYDGKDNPLSGNENADTIAVTRIDRWTFEALLKKRGKVMTTVRNTVSKDGKTMTVTAKGVNAQGQPVSSTTVFVKQ
jgi:hypothetical protein